MYQSLISTTIQVALSDANPFEGVAALEAGIDAFVLVLATLAGTRLEQVPQRLEHNRFHGCGTVSLINYD